MDFEEEDSPILRKERETGPSRWTGGVLVLVALALAVCLATYNHGEMGWSGLNPEGAAAAAAVPCTNALGVCGLYLAGILYWLFGSCAYYALFLSLLLGIGILVHPRRSILGQALAMLAMLVLACAVMSVQTLCLQAWAAAHPSGSAGGMLGYLDGTLALGHFMTESTALAVLIFLHGIALVYAARLGFRAVGSLFWADVCGTCAWLAQKWREQRRRSRLRSEERARMLEEKRMRMEAEAARQAQLEARTGKPFQVDTPENGADSSPRQDEYSSHDLPSEEDDAPPPSLLEQLEARRKTTAAAQRIQQPPSSRTIRRAGDSRKGQEMHPELTNLLDLNPQGESAPESRPAAAGEGPHISDSLRRSMNRHMGIQEPEAAPEPPPAPARKPAPESRKAPAARAESPDYPLPPYDLLEYKPVSPEVLEAAEAEMAEMQRKIIDTLDSFKIQLTPGPITRGPSFTRYEFYPPSGLRVKKLLTYDKDLMASTSSKSVNILAPIPGKNTIGVELENLSKSPVYLRELLQSKEFNSPKHRIPVALGKDVYGTPVIGDLAAMPHTLVAGTTGSGKSVCINSMILSMLYKFRPDELRLVLVDPKCVEMQPYRKLPHLACPVVTNPPRVIGALRWAVNEMEHRYRLFSKLGVRNFEDFNARDITKDPGYYRDEEEETYDEDEEEAIRRGEELADEILASNESRGGEIEKEQGELDLYDEEDGPAPEKLPYVVIIIDELADLMQQVKDDLENYIARLTQKARAAGIHLVAATQTPRRDVVTGLIKANIPSRIAFRVASGTDSRVILDTIGAENLLGKGDCLFLPPGGITKMTRAQGAFVTDAEIASIIAFCASHASQKFDQAVNAEMNNAENAASAANGGGDNGGRIGGAAMSDADSELLTRCISLVVTERKASTSLLQRRFSIGYGKAAKIMDMMEERGIISPAQGPTRAREVLVDAPE